MCCELGRSTEHLEETASDAERRFQEPTEAKNLLPQASVQLDVLAQIRKSVLLQSKRFKQAYIRLPSSAAPRTLQIGDGKCEGRAKHTSRASLPTYPNLESNFQKSPRNSSWSLRKMLRCKGFCFFRQCSCPSMRNLDHACRGVLQVLTEFLRHRAQTFSCCWSWQSVMLEMGKLWTEAISSCIQTSFLCRKKTSAPNL